MAKEARTQEKLIRYLKSKGCYVFKPKPGPGVPVGAPDVIALLEGTWLAFEVKASCTAPYRPLQKETLDKLAEWSFVYSVYPENFEQVVEELEQIL